jgi:hypothetical protein
VDAAETVEVEVGIVAATVVAVAATVAVAAVIVVAVAATAVAVAAPTVVATVAGRTEGARPPVVPCRSALRTSSTASSAAATSRPVQS